MNSWLSDELADEGCETDADAQTTTNDGESRCAGSEWVEVAEGSGHAVFVYKCRRSCEMVPIHFCPALVVTVGWATDSEVV